MVPLTSRSDTLRRRGVGAHLRRVLATALAVGAGCAADRPGPATAVPGDGAGGPDAPIAAIVSILPQAEFVRRVGGDRVTVETLVGAGQSPETFEPTPQQLARLASAQVYFTIGVPLEAALVPRLVRTAPALRVVDTREGVPLLAPSGTGHGHGGATDPHIWLDPRRVPRQLETIASALAEIAPAHRALFAANRDSFAAEMEALDAELSALLAPYRGRSFYVYHPAFGYLAVAYGLQQVAVETAGREPTPRELAELIERARADGVAVLYTQPQYAARGAHAVADVIGAELVVLDDLAPRYAENLRRMGRHLAAGFAAMRALSPAGRPAAESSHE
jgi:zinc transport system substrate-binding protein